MTDQENTINKLESQFPAMSGVTFTQASHKMLKAGQSVLQTEEGVVYEYYPDGRRQHIKDIEPPTPVTPGQIVAIQ